MAAIVRRTTQGLRSTSVTLATADDLNGTSDGSQWYAVTGCNRILLSSYQGTLGTAGIDVLEVSHDGGINWASDDTVLLHSSNDTTGTVMANGALNAAGIDPVTNLTGLYTAGPWDGPTAVRITRDVSVNASSAAWVTGAPSVTMIVFGGSHNGGAPSTTLR